MTDVTCSRIPEEIKSKIRRRFPHLNFSKAQIKCLRGFFEFEEKLQTKDEKIEELKKALDDVLRQSDSGDFSREACIFLDYDSKGKPFCRNKKAPIDTRDLTPKACMNCSAYQRSKPSIQRVIMRSTSMEPKKEEHRIPEQRVPEEPKQPFNKESDQIYCPHKKEYIDKSRCDLCKTLRWNTWRNCQEIRLRNPNDPMFHPS